MSLPTILNYQWQTMNDSFLPKDQLSTGQRTELLALAERVAGVGHWLVDLNENSVFWSDEVYRIHGVTPEDYSPTLETAIDFYHPDDVDDVRVAVEQAIAAGKAYEFECRIVRRNGEIRQVHSRATVQVDDNGKAVAVFGIFQDVTDQRATERELAETNERYELAVNGSSAGIWDLNFRTNELYWSPRLYEILGMDSKTSGAPIDEFQKRLHPDDVDRLSTLSEAHLHNRVPFEAEYRLLHEDGAYRWIHATGQAIWKDDGEAIRMSGSVLDITDRKHDELMRDNISRLLTNDSQSSSESITKLLDIGLTYLGLDIAIISSIQDDTYVVEHVIDRSDTLQPGTTFPLGETYCSLTVQSPEVTAYSNAGRSEICGHPCYEAFQLESYIGVGILEDGIPVGTVNFSAAAARERPFGQREKSFVAMLTKWITYELNQQKSFEELKRSRDLVAQKERELDLVFNTVPVRIWYKDDKNRILRLNADAADSMGMAVADAEGADTYELFPSMAAKYHKDDLEVINSGKPLLNIIEEYTPRDGEVGWVRTDKVPYIDPSNGARHIVVVSQDITEQMQAQQDLRRTNQDLDDFAYVASHDLRAPMSGIETLTEWIEEDLGDDVSEETRENLQLLRSRVQRMDRMLSDILDYSRAGRSHAETSEVDCEQLVDDVISWIDCGDFKVSADPGLPTIHAAPTSLQQVFQNLITNAIKHHDKDTGHIRIACNQDDDYASFSVIDDGPGIDESYREQIFKMFETLARRDDVEGTGIGLSIVERLVESMGGQIAVNDSPYGRGSAFQFTLPLKQKSA